VVTQIETEEAGEKESVVGEGGQGQLLRWREKIDNKTKMGPGLKAEGKGG